MSAADRPDYGSRTPDALAAQFRRFGRVEAPQLDSPLYEELCEAVAANPELLELAAHTDPSQPPPNLLLASVQYLLLRGASHPLAAHYPYLSGEPAPEEPAFPAFRAFCLSNRETIEQLLATRRTQTNVPRRCSCLLPAFATIQTRARLPLALVEIGTSAGLNLHWDRYWYDYQPGPVWGDAASGVRLETELRGERALPELAPTIPVLWRRGIDIHPIDPADDDATLWLRALIWPEHLDRHRRLAAAIDLARREPQEILSGDATVLLPDLLERAPASAALVVFATHALYQFPRDARRSVYQTLEHHSRARDVDFLSMEGTGVDHSELWWTRYRAGDRETTKLANCHPHGWWLEWLDAGGS